MCMHKTKIVMNFAGHKLCATVELLDGRLVFRSNLIEMLCAPYLLFYSRKTDKKNIILISVRSITEKPLGFFIQCNADNL